jgi:hypothetical protein
MVRVPRASGHVYIPTSFNRGRLLTFRDRGGRLSKLAFLLALGSVVAGCATATRPADNAIRVSMPASAGWYADKRVYYITTEISDPSMSTMAGATYTPRLHDAVPTYPKPPSARTVLERVYKFPNADQEPVFASAPTSPGPASTDRSYSPLWLVYVVNWKDLSQRAC